MQAVDAQALCRTYLAYLRLAGDVIEGPRCRAVRCDTAPLIYDANHLQVDPGADIEAVMAFFEEVLGDRDHRQVITTLLNDPGLDARLSLEGYTAEVVLQGLLDGPLRGPAPIDCDIRLVETAQEWVHLDRLVRADHVETNQVQDRHDYTLEVTDQMQAIRRRVASEVKPFMAWDEGEPVAFFCSWPGIDGVGMVEDLFTLPTHRKRGFARALIHHCVADARTRGADRVLIGAEPDDTPKHIYAAMGFEPTCLTWGWLRKRGQVD